MFYLPDEKLFNEYCKNGVLLQQPKLRSKNKWCHDLKYLHSVFGVNDIGYLVQHVIGHSDPR